jgi:hypothetical protein
MARALTFALAVVCACGPEPVGKPPADAGADAALVEEPLAAAELDGVAKAVSTAAEVPLTGPALQVRSGDWLLESEEAVALVSGEDGRVTAFGAPRGPTGLYALEPAAFEPFDRLEGDVELVEPAAGGRGLHLRKRLRAEPLVVESWLGLRGRVLRIRSRLVALGAVPAVTHGEWVAWGNTPTWVEGHGFAMGGGDWSAAFLARENQGLAYAFCREDGVLMARIGSPSSPGYHRSAKTGEQRVALAAGASTPLRRVDLSFALGSLGDAVAALPCAPPSRSIEVPREARVVAARTRASIEVTSCESEAAWKARVELEQVEREKKPVPEDDESWRRRGAGPPFARFRLHRDRHAIAVPEPCARVRLAAPGWAPGAWLDPTTADETGWGHPKLGPRSGTLRWRVRGEDGAVLPATIVVRGEDETDDPDWGDEGKGGAARNFVYAEGDGERPLPPGKYRVIVHRGFEYSLVDRHVTVKADAAVEIDAKLERSVDTSGWLSADLHVHAMPSFDAPTLLEDRVRSLAGVGVEVAVSTDHNVVTDYRPAIAALGVGRWMGSVIGDEVTTDMPPLGHFNVFPLAEGSATLQWKHATADEVFQAARRAAPGGVLQVNHPRMDDIGYFELFRLDRRFVGGWTAGAELVEMGFDAIEVLNGDHYAEPDEVANVMEDWYALLDAGLRYTATGNSDSHKIAYQEAGMPRNFVAMGDDEPAALDVGAFARAIREGHVVVSTGPFIDFRAGDAKPGDTVPAGETKLAITVDGPAWMSLAEVELVRRGHVMRRWEVTGKARPRFHTEVTVATESGDWLLVVARGDAAMEQLYREDAMPFAFTNPVWAR